MHTLQCFGRLSFLRTPVCVMPLQQHKQKQQQNSFPTFFGVRMCRFNRLRFVIRLFVSPLVSCLLVVGPSVYNRVHFEPHSDLRNFPCRLLISGTYT